MDVQTHRWVVRSMLVIRVSVTGITFESVLIARSCSVAEEVGGLIRSMIVQQQVPFAIIVVGSGTSVRFVDRPYRHNRHNSNYRSPFLALGKEIKTGHLEEIKLRCL